MGIFIIFLIANLTDIYWRERERRSCPIAGKLELGQDIKAFIYIYFFFMILGVWTSLRAPQLIVGPTEHLISPIVR